ncbi:class I SAM-dependent methyltransferase [Patescibacteria group bacterium]|nr:class I SAM-dependent methyltransferase [Patescibacteria group bacterium]
MKIKRGKLIGYFQKIKWEILSRLNPNHYIFSVEKTNDAEFYRNSGQKDFKRLILEDPALKESFGGTILEIGCGNGRMTEFLPQVFENIYAVDISLGMIGLAKKRLTNPKIHLSVCDGDSFKLEAGTVDLVFSYIVFQHFPTRDMVENNLSEAGRVLKSGGLAKIQFRGRPSSGGKMRFLKWYYGVHFQKSEIEKIAQKAGLKLVSVLGEGEKEMWCLFRKN